jgi:hypothetical protein
MIFSISSGIASITENIKLYLKIFKIKRKIIVEQMIQATKQ